MHVNVNIYLSRELSSTIVDKYPSIMRLICLSMRSMRPEWHRIIFTFCT